VLRNLARLGPLALALAACVRAPAPAAESPTSKSLSKSKPKRAYRQAQTIHVSIAPRIREVSVVHGEIIREVSAANIPPLSKHRSTKSTKSTTPSTPPRIPTTIPDGPIRTPADLRARVGVRDKRDPNVIALAWATDLGVKIDATSSELVPWAEKHGRLLDVDALTEPGDLLVFDKVVSDDEADLVGVVISRDDRGVTEFIYVGNGVVRRGFVDVSRRSKKRDKSGAVVNTYLRHGRRWPLKGTHYLAGEHLAHVIR
jgi:hypothetical protein